MPETIEGEILLPEDVPGGALMLPFAEVGPLLPAVVYGTPDGLRLVLDRLTAAVMAEKVDISTPKGRAAAKRLGRKIASSKVALDDIGKQAKAEWLAKSNAVDLGRREMRAELEALQDRVMRDLLAWEAEDDARIKGHADALAALQMDPAWYAQEHSAAALRERLEALRQLLREPTRVWQEFRGRMEDVLSDEIASVAGMLSVANKREADEALAAQQAAEAAEVARAAAQAAQEEHEARIAAEAAEQARIATEAAAKAAADALAVSVEAERVAAAKAAEDARLAVEAERAKAERERKAIEEKAEADRLAGIERERKLQADAEAARLAVIEKDRLAGIEAERLAAVAKQAAEAAEERHRVAVAAAEQKVRDDAARAKEAQDAADRARAEDVAHRTAVNRATLEAMEKILTPMIPIEGNGSATDIELAASIAYDACEAIISAILLGKIPNVKLEY